MESESQKVLLANADRDELEALAQLVEQAGHDVVALTITAAETADAIVENRPTMAMILVEGDEDHALDLMVEIRSFADIPLVVLARSISDPSLQQAAELALEVLHVPGTPDTVAKVIETAGQRFSERKSFERRVGEFDGILERRTIIEQAKGILMERHGIDANEAFGRIRDLARSKQLRVADVAASVITARDLLGPGPGDEGDTG